MSATAAHELKTPLTLIRGQIELGVDQVQQLLHLAEASEPQNYEFASVDASTGGVVLGAGLRPFDLPGDCNGARLGFAGETRRAQHDLRSQHYPTRNIASIMTYAIPATPPASIPPPRRALRRAELRKIIPLSNTTIYEMERRGDPKRFYLTSRCVVWDSDEVYAWLDARKQPEQQTRMGRAPVPNVSLRRRRPLKSSL